MIFNPAEHVIIDLVKANLQILMNNKKIFWNGVTTDCVIAGGYFASAFRDEPYKDIDVFILNNNDPVYKALTDNSNSDMWTIRDSVGAPAYLQNPHIHGTALNTNTKVQYILTDYTSRKELLKSFDYIHTTVSYVPVENKLYITRDAYDACKNGHLIVNGNNNTKQWRENKFVKRGWVPITVSKEIHQGLNDGFQYIIDNAVKDMMDRLSVPSIHNDDPDFEDFKALVK